MDIFNGSLRLVPLQLSVCTLQGYDWVIPQSPPLHIRYASQKWICLYDVHMYVKICEHSRKFDFHISFSVSCHKKVKLRFSLKNISVFKSALRMFYLLICACKSASPGASISGLCLLVNFRFSFVSDFSHIKRILGVQRSCGAKRYCFFHHFPKRKSCEFCCKIDYTHHHHSDSN